MTTAMLIFLGGGAGSVLRWLTGLGAVRLFGAGFPSGTLAVNLVGCFAMGVLARVLLAHEAGGNDTRFLLMTGLLGGYTTFSAFALDAAHLWMRDAGSAAFLYIAISVLGSLAMVALGLWLGAQLSR
ncbi:MAG: fluoride efflux transporter CrcB [Rhizobiales bacterium]|nr:fluoride efflux transporter CrcB [Hyphomicrobiales bacterium]